MAKRKARQRHQRKPAKQKRSKKRSALLVGLVLSLILATGIMAHLRSLSPGSQSAVVTLPLQPQDLTSGGQTPTTVAKDYIYAGGRLLATESLGIGGSPGSGNGIVPDPPPDSDPPPPIIYTDMAVWRPSNGTWYVHNTVDGSMTAQLWGMAGDKPVPGDYDGDGKLDFAVFRPSNSTWYILRSSNGAVDAPQWGLGTDEPVPGDYDGDGKTDVAVRSGNTWQIRKSSDPTGNTSITQQWGEATDLAVQGDYDGDGHTDIATMRPSDATWTIRKSSNPEDEPTSITQQWGETGDVPQVGDFDGDMITDFVTFRASDTVWRILSSFDSSSLSQQWGLSTDQPAPGDYDGDGKTDIAVVRPRVSATDNHSTWHILRSSDGSLMSAQWGIDGDVAVPGKYNRVSQTVCANCS
jgi:hypothetical protein